MKGGLEGQCYLEKIMYRALMLAAALALFSLPATSASAQEAHGWTKWKAGEAERSTAGHKFGAKCSTAVTSRGSGPVGFGITQFWAKRHTQRNWEAAVAKLESADYASWSRAKGKAIECVEKEKVWNCKATANPCKK